MSDFKIIGDPNPVVGKEIIYKTSDFSLPASLSPGQAIPDGHNPFVEQVKWSVYILEFGKWILKEKNNKTGPTANYTFTEKSLKRKGIRIVARLGEEKAILDIKPQDTIERRIVKVELCDALGNLQTKPFAYNQTVLAKVHCLNLNDCTVHVTLWEDDAPGAGHSEINKNNKAVTKSERISNGIANVKFKLAIDFAKIANARLAKGDKSEGKTHEYYVTAEIFRQKTESSNNINVINPEKNGTAAQATPQKPSPRPTDPAAKKGKSKKEEKGIAETVSGTIYDWGETILKAIPIILPDPIEVVNSLAKIFTPDKKEEEEGKGICVCKENNFYWSDKLTCEERKKVLQVCSNLWGEDKKKEKASELMAIMHLETGSTFKSSADNGAGFSGLIQFSDAAAKGLGTTRAKLKAMTFIDQMAFVEDYFKKKKDQLKTMVDLYLLVLKPNAVGNGSNSKYVLFDESIDVPDGDGSKTSPEQRAININQEPWVTKYGYSSNPSFMKEENERVKREKWVYTRQKKEQRWGFNNGKTTIGEVIQELTEKHYRPGALALFKDACESLKSEDKSEDKERPSWMKTALEEAKTYGGKDESDIDSRIKTYHSDGGGSPGSGSETAWCASFVCWCLEESGNKSPKSAGSRIFLDSKNVEKCEVFYGAVAIFSDCDSTGKKIQSSGHATFVFGELSGDNIYTCLGGNQGDMLKISKYDCSGNVFVSYTTKKGVKHYKIFRGFYKPKGYEIKDIDKLNKDDKYTSADEASKKVLKLNIKSNESGESSR
ncbi:MAG: hypothetical protein ABI576_05190 [Flavobacterium sp.]